MNWIEVVTNPLGLVAYALALIFGVAGRLARETETGFYRLLLYWLQLL